MRYYAQTFGGSLVVTQSGEMVYAFRGAQKEGGRSQGWVMKEKLVGASAASPKGLDSAKTRVNYFIGNDRNKWRTDLPTYNIVSLGEVYPGIELALKAYGENVEKIFRVNPGAEPAKHKAQDGRCQVDQD